MARGAVKCVSINGALTVTFVAASGATPTVFSDEACTTPTALPATVADGSATTFYFASPGSYTLSVKTASGVQIAGDLNTTKVVTVAAGDVGVYAYDTRLVSRDASGDSGRHSPNTDLAATYATVGALAPTFIPAKAKPTLWTSFQTGHGWTLATTAGGTPTTDTSDFLLGSQSISMVTDGAGNTQEVSKTGMTTVDLTDKTIAVLVKVSDVTKLPTSGGMGLYFGNGGFTNFQVAATLRGAATESASPLRSGEWTWVHLNPNENVTGVGGIGKQALGAVTDVKIKMNDNAGGTGITVHIGAIGYFKRQQAFPRGVVSFTFDDSIAEQYSAARVVLDKYGVGGSAFIIADGLGGAGAMTLAQLHDMEDNHRWEVCGHAYYSANHNAGYPNLTVAQVEDDILTLKNFLRGEGFRGADWFAWPLGQSTATLAAQISQYFSFARHVDGLPREQVPHASPFRVKAITLTSGVAPAIYQSAVDEAFTLGAHVIFVGHKIVASGGSGSDYTQADLQTLVDYCITKGVPIRTVGEVLHAIKGTQTTTDDFIPAYTTAMTQTVTPGRWTVPGYNQTTAALTLNTLALHPMWINKTCTLAQAAMQVSATIASGVARIGIYNSDNTGAPNALLYDSGAIDCASSTGVKTVSPALVVTPGLYWVGGVLQTAAATVFVSSVASTPALTADTSGNAIAQNPGNYTATGVTGALPATFTPAGAFGNQTLRVSFLIAP